MARTQKLRLVYRDGTHDPGPPAPHLDVVRGFEQLGYRALGRMAVEVVPGGLQALVAGYSGADREALLEHGADPCTVLLSPDGSTVARVGWFWSSPGVDLFSLDTAGSRVETHSRWDEVPPWPGRLAGARRFARLDGEMHRPASRGRSVAVVAGADPKRMHAAHADHLRAHLAAHGGQAVPLPATVAELAPLYERAQDHAGAVADRCVTVVRAQCLLYAAVVAAVFYWLGLSGRPLAAYGWLVLALLAFLTFQAPVAVRTFYTRWWRPAYR
ncbi:MAG: hypothetical protein ACTHKG_00215 [Nocardioides sp.]